jgi:hypothetical protein
MGKFMSHICECRRHSLGQRQHAMIKDERMGTPLSCGHTQQIIASLLLEGTAVVIPSLNELDGIQWGSNPYPRSSECH